MTPEGMNAGSIARYIVETFVGIDVVTADGNRFFFYDPDREIPPDRRFPFATLVTNDLYDTASDLSRPDVFRLNVGAGKAGYERLFGAGAPRPGSPGVTDTGHDFTDLDRIMPHPVYGQMYWVCVLNPSAATFESVRPLLAEAYDLAAGRHARQAQRRAAEPS
jgi:hypothetical protein